MIALLDQPGTSLASLPVDGLERLPSVDSVLSREQPDAVVIGPGEPDPVRTIQRVGALEAPVVICVPASKVREIEDALRFAPQVPVDVTVVDTDDPERLTAEVRRAAERSRRRKRNAADIAAANGMLFRDFHPAGGPVLDQLLEIAPVGILSTDSQGTVQSWNALAARLFADKIGEGRHVRELFDPQCGNAVAQLLGAEGPSAPIRLTAANGERHFDLRSAPFVMGSASSGVLLAVVDVTDRKRIEDEIARVLASERHARAEAERAEMRAAFLARAATELASSLDYRTTLASIVRLAVPDVADWAAVHMIAEDGTLQRVALAHTDAAGIGLARDLDGKYPPGQDSPLWRVIKTGQPQFFPDIPLSLLEMFARDSEHLAALKALEPRSSILVPVRSADGQVLGAITLLTADSGRRYSWADLRLAGELANRVSVAVQNSTLYAAAEQRREQAEATADQLRRVNAELEQFAWVTSHDLQEPLRTVASFAQLLERRHGPALPPDAREYIAHVVEGARRMSHLIHDLLEYSRVTRSEGPRMQSVNLMRVAAECLESLRGAIGESGATITVGELPSLQRANKSQMQQLLLNLLSNAIKYSRPGVPPDIRVEAAREEELWHFRVIDNGQGFEAAFQDRIFGIFKRLHGRDVPGTGIGLALCRRIVEGHGGRIWAESRPGEGSVFHFTIPD